MKGGEEAERAAEEHDEEEEDEDALDESGPQHQVQEQRLESCAPPGDSATSNSGKKTKKKKRKTTAQKTAAKRSAAVPVSHVDRSLPLPEGVRVEYFDHVKGKGLVAARDFKEEEVIFVENAFIAAPPAVAVDQVLDGTLCSDCFQPLQGGNLVARCGKSSCKSRFCNRV